MPAGADEPDEEELRRRLLEYRALRDAAAGSGGVMASRPVMRREPRESDLPEVPAAPMPPNVLAAALETRGGDPGTGAAATGGRRT